MKHIKFPSINQFRNVVTEISHKATFIGLSDNNEPLYDDTLKLPTITAIGSEKIHGTNAGICCNNHSDFWVQSRYKILTKTNDNYNCASEAIKNKKSWRTILDDLIRFYDIDISQNTIALYFEWCGGKIQKQSAVSGLSKRSIIFKYFKVIPNSNPEDYRWLPTKIDNKWVEDTQSNIFNVMNYDIWFVRIDFNHPQKNIDTFHKIIKEIETSSPIGKAMDKPDNIGEGVVFSFFYKNQIYFFKIKGEKHNKSKSKPKIISTAEEALIQSIDDFVKRFAATPNRLNQFYSEICDNIPDMKYIGEFLKAVNNDVFKEEEDIINEFGMNQHIKKLKKAIMNESKKWFMNKQTDF